MIASVGGVEISTGLSLPDVSREGAARLVRSQALSGVGEVEVVVTSGISGEVRIIEFGGKIDGCSLKV